MSLALAGCYECENTFLFLSSTGKQRIWPTEHPESQVRRGGWGGGTGLSPQYKGCISQSVFSLAESHWAFLKFIWKEAKTGPAGGGQDHLLRRGAGGRTEGSGLSPNYLLSLSPSFFRGEGDSISKVLSGPTLWAPMEGSDLLILGKGGRWCRRT